MTGAFQGHRRRRKIDRDAEKHGAGMDWKLGGLAEQHLTQNDVDEKSFQARRPSRPMVPKARLREPVSECQCHNVLSAHWTQPGQGKGITR
eukprot:3171764-Alexandrium_andersonii.AAC.1